MTQSIYPADKTDAARINAVIRASFATVAEEFGLNPQNSPTHPSNSQPEWIEKAMAKGVRFFLMTENGRTIGCVGLERANADVCYLERLAVIPEERNRGLGETLVRFALDQAHENDARRVEIATFANQTALRRWYERFGFTFIRTARFEQLMFEVAFMGLDLEGRS